MKRPCQNSEIPENGPSKIIHRDRKTSYRSNVGQDFFRQVFHQSFDTASESLGYFQSSANADATFSKAPQTITSLHNNPGPIFLCFLLRRLLKESPCRN